jgi:hypothetical protein
MARVPVRNPEPLAQEHEAAAVKARVDRVAGPGVATADDVAVDTAFGPPFLVVGSS